MTSEFLTVSEIVSLDNSKFPINVQLIGSVNYGFSPQGIHLSDGKATVRVDFRHIDGSLDEISSSNDGVTLYLFGLASKSVLTHEVTVECYSFKKIDPVDFDRLSRVLESRRSLLSCCGSEP